MKVLYITTSFPSHPHDMAGIFVLNLARALVKESHDMECTVLTPAASSSSNWPEDINVIRFQYAPKKTQLLAQRPGGIPQALREKPAAFLLVPGFLLSMLGWIVRLAPVHDVIHAHWSITGFTASLAANFSNVYLITTIHGSDFNMAKRNVVSRFIMQRTLKKSHIVAGVSKSILDGLKEVYPAYSEKIVFVPNGVNDIFYSISPLSKKADSKINFLYIGSLIPLKGVDTLISACGRLGPTANWSLTIVGDGLERERLKALCREHEITDRVRFLGVQPPDRIPGIMQTAHCLILPSYSEGRPSVILEAMAAGLPVIATDIPGTNELVLDGVNGWLFKAGDFHGLGKILKKILDAPEVLVPMGRKGREMMLENGLTWQSTARRYIELYKKVAGCRKGAD